MDGDDDTKYGLRLSDRGLVLSEQEASTGLFTHRASNKPKRGVSRYDAGCQSGKHMHVRGT